MNGQTTPPPYDPPSDYQGAFDGPLPERPRSGIAIAAFVCSVLGCLGVTAVAGIVLGVVGIVQTAGGKRRGLGWAVAALPISCLTGIMFIVIAISSIYGMGIFKARQVAIDVLKSDAPEAARMIREVASADLGAAADERRVGAWLTQIQGVHGTFVGFARDKAEFPVSEDGRVQTITYTGKFVNGNAPVSVTTSPSLSLEHSYRLEDLSVDGLSLKKFDAGAAPPQPADGDEETTPSENAGSPPA